MSDIVDTALISEAAETETSKIWDYETLIGYLNGTQQPIPYVEMPEAIDIGSLNSHIEELTKERLTENHQRGAAYMEVHSQQTGPYFDFKIPLVAYLPIDKEPANLEYASYFPPDPRVLHDYFLTRSAARMGHMGVGFISDKLTMLVLRTFDTASNPLLRNPALWENYQNRDMWALERWFNANKAAEASHRKFLSICQMTGLVPYIAPNKGDFLLTKTPIAKPSRV